MTNNLFTTGKTCSLPKTQWPTTQFCRAYIRVFSLSPPDHKKGIKYDVGAPLSTKTSKNISSYFKIAFNYKLEDTARYAGLLLAPADAKAFCAVLANFRPFLVLWYEGKIEEEKIHYSHYYPLCNTISSWRKILIHKDSWEYHKILVIHKLFINSFNLQWKKILDFLWHLDFINSFFF